MAALRALARLPRAAALGAGRRCLAAPAAAAAGGAGAARQWQLVSGAAAAAGLAGALLCDPQRAAARAEGDAQTGVPFAMGRPKFEQSTFYERLMGSSETDVPFTMDKPKFDQSTFYGRLLGMYDIIDPRPLFLSSADIQRSKDMLEKYKAAGKKPEGVSDAEMWSHRKNVEVSLHPVTGELLFPLGRMSAFVPMNVPLCAIMLMAQSPGQVVFTQWLNQTYSVMNNYVNRSGATIDWSGLLTSYGLAVGASCSIALGANKLIAAVPALQAAGPFVPYLAVIVAGSANVSFTRMEEWRGGGISIRDADGKDLGKSQKAGQIGVLQTVLSRSCFLPSAPMVLPVLAMKALSPYLKVRPVAIAANLALITVCLAGMLPVALALLPQTMEISVSGLEPEFQNLKDSKGQPVTKVYGNKGL